jgi:hypothetical protein
VFGNSLEVLALDTTAKRKYDELDESGVAPCTQNSGGDTCQLRDVVDGPALATVVGGDALSSLRPMHEDQTHQLPLVEEDSVTVATVMRISEDKFRVCFQTEQALHVDYTTSEMMHAIGTRFF